MKDVQLPTRKIRIEFEVEAHVRVPGAHEVRGRMDRHRKADRRRITSGATDELRRDLGRVARL